MDEQPPKWIIITTLFLTIGLACAGCILIGPDWMQPEVSLPANAAQPTPTTVSPTATTPPPLPTVTLAITFAPLQSAPPTPGE